ncbi:MAG TPA: translation initiation factor IF-2 N-terminal domain-containing protein, partial [Acidobacteriaceae bacterium]|nr:translation initiation factor IF-2 N-terminal domain-containing protein [Acidobacteriaceae bacterium]
MSKVRINDLARELEVKSRAILDALTHVGVVEKKTHSSSLEEDEAERVRQHFQRTGKNGASAAKVVDSEPKQKIDWSRVSKPGDVLKAIQQRKDEAAAIAQRPPLPQTPVAKPAAPAHPVASASPVASQAPGVPSAAAPRPPAASPPAATPPTGAPPNQAVISGQGLPVQARPNLGGPTAGSQGQQRTPPPPPPAPRRIVPQPRQEPRIVVAPPPLAPAIAAKPPAGPVVARPPLSGAEVRPPATAPGMARPAVPGTEVRPPAA